MHWSYSVNIACRAASPLALPTITHMPVVPSVPFLAALGVTLPSGDFSLLFHDGTRSGFEATPLFRGRQEKQSKGYRLEESGMQLGCTGIFYFCLEHVSIAVGLPPAQSSASPCHREEVRAPMRW